MKKFFTILLLVSGMLKIASAQAPNWKWVESSTGQPFEYGCGVSVDNAGHLFLSGRISGAGVSFGGQTATAPALNPFEEEFDTAGNGIWFQTHYYSSGNDYPGGFFRDDKNNTYGNGIIGSSCCGMYVEKRNSSGTMPSPFPLTFTGASVAGLGITADKSGNIYLTGAENPGTITMNNGVTCTNSGSGMGAFVAKLDSNGRTEWAKPIYEVGGTIAGRDILVDNKGNIYVVGEYTGSPVFGTLTAPASSGFSNYFIAKYDTAGTALSVFTASSASTGIIGQPTGSIHCIAIDSCGNLFATGQIQGTAVFGSLSILGSVGGKDMFVAKCDKNGNWQWVSTAGSTADDRGLSIALDKYNEVYVGGDYGGNMDFGNGATIGGSGGIFVAKYANSTGQALWAQSGLGATSGHMEGLDVDRQGYVYIIGDYAGTAIFGSHSVMCSNPYSNIFLAKLDTVPPRTIVPVVASFYCPGSNAVIPYTITGTFNGSNVFTAELSDSTGSFISPVVLGITNSTTGGNINIAIPGNTPSGSNYLIRVVSSNPGTSSYVNGCGAYFVNNVYINVDPVTIGGSITVKVSNDTTICSGSFVRLHASGGSTYSWSPGATLNDSTSADPYAAPTSPQNYTVTVSSGSCGSATGHVRVDVSDSANIRVSPDSTTACSGSSISLTASGAASYIWMPSIGLSCTTCANPTVMPLVNTTYTVTGNNGVCSNTLLIKVNVGNTSIGGTIVSVRDTICQNTPGNLTLTKSVGSTIQWQSSIDSINFTDLTGDTLLKLKTVPLQQTTWYRVAVGSGNCSAISDTLELYVPPTLTAKFNYTQSTATQLNFDSDSSGGSIHSYHWDFGDGTTSNAQNPSHTYAKDSTYYVCLTLYDGSNCSYTFCRYSIVTGIPTVAAMGNWVVYPDPFTNELIISAKNTASKIQSIEMYDVLGQLVVNKIPGNATNTSLQLDVSSLAKGMYYVMIRTTEVDYVQKVVKQ